MSLRLNIANRRRVMSTSRNPRDQSQNPKGGAQWIADRLVDRLMFGIRSNGRIKEITLRLQKDGENFPMRWFRDFAVTLWLADGTTIACEVNEAKNIKRKWFFLLLTPSADYDDLSFWDDLEEDDVLRIELATGEERLLFVWHEDLRLFMCEEVH